MACLKSNKLTPIERQRLVDVINTASTNESNLKNRYLAAKKGKNVDESRLITLQIQNCRQQKANALSLLQNDDQAELLKGLSENNKFMKGILKKQDYTKIVDGIHEDTEELDADLAEGRRLLMEVGGGDTLDVEELQAELDRELGLSDESQADQQPIVLPAAPTGLPTDEAPNNYREPNGIVNQPALVSEMNW